MTSRAFSHSMVVTVTLNPSLDEWVRLPHLLVGELNRATAFARYPGGKGINVSRVVHELGERTMAMALAGGDDGHILSNGLRRQGIPHRFLSIPGSTRNNYQLHTTSPSAITQINCPGPRVSLRALARLERLLVRLRHRAPCVVLSGSLPPGLTSRTYQRLIHTLRSHHLPVVLDTSGPALRYGVAARPWLIKPNRHEAEELLGRRLPEVADAALAAKRLTARGPAIVIISLGMQGAVLAAAAHATVWWAQSPSVRVQSTVGAGDALVAGFVVGWRRTHSLQEAFRLGVACGAASVMTLGTELCHRKDVVRLTSRVRLHALSHAAAGRLEA